MSYVIAAYALTLATLFGYAARLAAEARALRGEIARERARGG